MNYKKLYHKIIQNAKIRNLPHKVNKKRVPGTVEHHYIPKSISPEFRLAKWNRIILTNKEHFVCHHLLTKIYKESEPILISFNMMCNLYKGKITATVYNNIRLKFSKIISKKYKNRIPWNKGIPCSKKTKHKISIARKGCKSFFKGRHHSIESKKKISIQNKGNIAWNRGKKHSKLTRKRISEAVNKSNRIFVPYIRTDDIKQKIKLAQLKRRARERKLKLFN